MKLIQSFLALIAPVNEIFNLIENEHKSHSALARYGKK